MAGRVADDEGEAVPDAMVEIWQAVGAGCSRHPADGRRSDVPSSFISFGLVVTSDEGGFELTTARPGTVPGRDGSVQAPHLDIHVFARGLLDRLWTRIHCVGNPTSDADPGFTSLPPERRSTLMAEPVDEDGELTTYRFDVVLQCQHEMVFFVA